MKIAVMQPYFFPYIGYFQLVKAVDIFVFYDDVNFIKKGWVNRNRILINCADNLLTIPCIAASQNKQINEVNIDYDSKEFKKILPKIHHAYKNSSPNFQKVFPLIEQVFEQNHESIAQFCQTGIELFSMYLEIETEFKVSSKNFADSKGLGKAERLISISKSLNSNEYINAQGGKELYSKEEFEAQGIYLKFLEPKISNIQYIQGKCNNFTPNLSIIDVLMFNSKEKISEMLNMYTLE